MARETPEVNGGSLADIAFLLLIFFLVTTTMDTDTGITRLLPPEPEEVPDDTPINRRNIMVILLNRSNRLMVNGEAMNLMELREKTIEFFTNPDRKTNLPVMKTTTVEFPLGSSARLSPEGTWTGEVSQGIVSLMNDRSTSYGTYIQVQNELVGAINELRNEFCNIYFHKDFDHLNTTNPYEKEIYDGIRSIYKMNISESEPKDVGGHK